MRAATELIQVSPRVCVWQRYEAKVKAELFSTLLETAQGFLLIDPIPLQQDVLLSLFCGRPIAGIFITNANHHRAATKFAEEFGARLFAHADTCTALKLPSATKLTHGQNLTSDIRALEIEGAAPGEMAIFFEAEGGVIIVGDALINFEPYGFTFLPAKYCSNAKQMRRSLRRLLHYDFEKMLFAHGTPVIESARKRLEQLLEDSD
jgi:glyoxylase-like metal-dependent hydrolase (beta-lactamase superfamily II)